MARKRQLIQHCSRCGSILTDNNAVRRKTGPSAGRFTDKCNPCNLFVTLRNRWKRTLSITEIDEKIEKYKQHIITLETIKKEKSK